MSINISWLLEGQIVIAKVYGEVTLQDLKTGNEVIGDYMQQSPYNHVHVIFDSTHITSISISAVQAIWELRYLRNPKMGCYLVYGMPQIFNNMLGISSKLFTSLTRVQAMHAFRDLPHALNFLQEFDRSLPDLPKVRPKPLDLSMGM
ncbi:MAG: hypothetical protein Kow00117_01540 [Phototrophicales bacterium]